MLTGDSLFVGDIARPDLAVEKEEGARGIFGSLRALLELGDDVEVWPGHLGGSLCGGPAMDLKVSTTIGYERRHNALLGVGDEDGVRRARDRRPAPAAAELQVDRGDQPRPAASAGRSTPSRSRRARSSSRDAPVIDIRTALQFDEAHIPGAISNTSCSRASARGWRGSPARTQPVVLVGRDDDDALRAAELAAAVGVGRIAGYLAGGMTSWREERLPTESIARLTVPELHERARRAADPRRARARRVGGRPHPRLASSRPTTTSTRCPDGLDPARPIAVICASGQRAAVGASLVQRYGAREVLHVVDGGVRRVGPRR